MYQIILLSQRTNHLLVAFLAVAVLLHADPLHVRAQVDDPPWVHMEVTPAAEPAPALKHSLLPSPLEQTPGNAAPTYFRVMLRLGLHPQWRDQVQQLAEWDRLPLDELPVDEIRKLIQSHYDFERLIDRAVLYERCDWHSGVKESGVHALAPELGQMRHLERIVALRTRVRIREGDHDAAIASLKTGFTMARHVAEEPMLINVLVGLGMARQMSDPLQELMAAPGSPNFYWPLAELDRGYIDMRPAIQGRFMLQWTFPSLRELSAVPMSPQQADELWASVFNWPHSYPWGVTWDRPLAAACLAMAHYSDAKAWLTERDHQAAAIEAMPVKQVVLLYLVADYKQHADELAKTFHLSIAEASEVRQQARPMTPKQKRQNPFLELLDDVPSARHWEASLRRRLALLRCVEAVRMHAAATDGQLPESLDALTVVPVPHDPSTNLPFEYQRQADGRTFTLQPKAGGPLPIKQGERLRVTVVQP